MKGWKKTYVSLFPEISWISCLFVLTCSHNSLPCALFLRSVCHGGHTGSVYFFFFFPVRVQLLWCVRSVQLIGFVDCVILCADMW